MAVDLLDAVGSPLPAEIMPFHRPGGTAAFAGTNDVDGSWIIEGHGVEPDIEVDNDPAALIAGRDPQLERGIEELLQRIESDPKRLPERPADPVKTE